jgi:hypothetical protein
MTSNREATPTGGTLYLLSKRSDGSNDSPPPDSLERTGYFSRHARIAAISAFWGLARAGPSPILEISKVGSPPILLALRGPW